MQIIDRGNGGRDIEREKERGNEKEKNTLHE